MLSICGQSILSHQGDSASAQVLTGMPLVCLSSPDLAQSGPHTALDGLSGRVWLRLVARCRRLR
jgi:hypothetical protein